MMQNGYICNVNHGDIWSYSKDIEHYDIHTRVLASDITPNKEGLEYFKDIFNNAVLTDKKLTYNLTPEYHLLYLIQHVAKHLYVQGAGVRMFLDIAVYLKHFDHLNWNYINTELEKIELLDFSYNMFSLCNFWFNTTI